MHRVDMQTAGFKTCADWRILRAKLAQHGDSALWKEAANDYFHERLVLRYLNPIKVVQDNGTYQGEGFSIVAIQCTLLEFLESTIKGLSYRCLRRGESLGPHEYSNSGDLFVSFLSSREPFASDFSKDTARDFYGGVRCGLLHEARTKNGWTICGTGPSGRVIDSSGKIVYRNNFQDALLKFIRSYERSLVSDVTLQSAFIRKFDSLCT